MLDSWRCRREVRCGLEFFLESLWSLWTRCAAPFWLSDWCFLRNLSQLCVSSPLRRCQTATGARILRTRIHTMQFWMQCPTITLVNCWERVWPTKSWDGWLWLATSRWIACVTYGACSLRLTVTWAMEWLQGRMCLKCSGENPTPWEGIWPISPHFFRTGWVSTFSTGCFLLLLMLRSCRCVPFFRLADVGILCVAVACNVSLVSCLHALKRLVQTSAWFVRDSCNCFRTAPLSVGKEKEKPNTPCPYTTTISWGSRTAWSHKSPPTVSAKSIAQILGLQPVCTWDVSLSRVEFSCNSGISSIHGKELPEQLSIHRKHNISHTRRNVRHFYKIGVWTKWDLRIGNNLLGESFVEIPVINWWRKSHQSSTHESLRLFGFCVVPWEESRKHSIERCMGTKIGDGWNLLENTETLTQLMVSQWNSSGLFSQDSIRCSSMKKSTVYCSD